MSKHDKQWSNAIKQLEKRGLLEPELIHWSEVFKSLADKSSYENAHYQMNPKTFVDMGGDLDNVPDHIELIY